MTRSLGSGYSLEELVGRGAMGEVWSARATATGERVAAKLLRDEFVSDQDVLTRFVQERAILVALRHPNLVQVRDLVVEGSDLAIILDFVEGTDLRRHLDAVGTLPPEEAIRITCQVLDALAVTHSARVLHRDIKPDNVLLDLTGEVPEVRLSDFGIARLAEGTAIRSSQLIGTPEYIAPEAISTEVVTAATDVYGTGIVLYELLAGRTPFASGGQPYAVIKRHVDNDPPVIEGLPEALWRVIAQMLSKDPAERPDAVAAAALLRGLRPEVAGLPALTPQTTPNEWRTSRSPAPTADRSSETIVPGQRSADLDEELAEAPAWVPAVEHDADDRGTRVQERPAVRREPGPSIPDEPPQPDSASSNNRRNLLIAAAATLVVTLGVGAFMILRGGGSSDEAAEDRPPDTVVPNATEADSVTLGVVGIDRTFELSIPEDGTATLTATVGYTAERGMRPSGPVVEAVPESILALTEQRPVWTATDGGEPPAPMPGSETLHRIVLPELDEDAPSELEYTIGGIVLESPDDEPVDGQAMLAEAMGEVHETLSTAISRVDLGSADASSFFLQSLTGIEVSAVEGAVEIGTSVAFDVVGVLGDRGRVPLARGLGPEIDQSGDHLQRLGVIVEASSGSCLGGNQVANQAGDCDLTVDVGDMTATTAVSVFNSSG